MIKAVLFDLDGVVRHFDPGHVAAIEARHGIAGGLIQKRAFSSPLLQQVTTGKMRRSQWIEVVGQCIGARAAAEEWGRQVPRVDHEVMLLVDALRNRGYVVAVLTNGTDTIAEEMRALGLDDRFDAIFNTATIGYAKPEPRAFRRVLEALDLHADEVFFTDDSARNAAGAGELGMPTHPFRGVSELRAALTVAGVEAG